MRRSYVNARWLQGGRGVTSGGGGLSRSHSQTSSDASGSSSLKAEQLKQRQEAVKVGVT